MSPEHKPADKHAPVVTLGNNAPGGTYILRLSVAQPLALVFGRFKGGKAVPIPPGECLYIGSALAGLGGRLARHASRSDGNPPHPIREAMLACFKTIGLGRGNLLPRHGKKLHWNVDYLLEHPAVVLRQVFIIRAEKRLEPALAQRLASDPATFIIERGLGAGDAPGNTHLLGVRGGEAWWQALPDKIAGWLGDDIGP